MATFNDTLYTKIIVDASQATQELSRFMSLGSQMGKIQSAGGDMQYKFDQLKTTLGENSVAFRVMKSQMNAVTQQSKEMKNRFDMNTLSWMFGGMALQRVGLMMTRFLIPSMDKLAQLNNESSKKVNGLVAAFEFLKISLFETLSQTPLFQKFVEWIIKAAIWIAEFTQQYPAIVEIAAVIGGLATVLGTLAIGIGIFKQLKHLTGLVKAMINNANLLGSSLKGLGAIAAIAFAIKLNWDMLTTPSTAKDRFWTVIGTTLSAALAGALIGSLIFPGVGTVVGGAIGAGIGFVVSFSLSIYDWIVEDKPNKSDFLAAIKEMFTGFNFFKNIGLMGTSLSFIVPIDLIFTAMGKTDERIRKEASLKKFETDINNMDKSIKFLGFDPLEMGNLESDFDLQVKAIKKAITAEEQFKQTSFKSVQERYKANESLKENISLLKELIPEYDKIKMSINDFESFDDTTSINNSIIDMENKMDSYSQKLKDVETIKLLNSVDVKELDKFKTSLENIKEPLSNIIILLNDEKGFYVGLKKITELFNLESNIVNRLELFNTQINSGNELIPTHISHIKRETTAMGDLADEILRAAVAQERLNRAKNLAGSSGGSGLYFLLGNDNSNSSSIT